VNPVQFSILLAVLLLLLSAILLRAQAP
jgi:hypothetical protein